MDDVHCDEEDTATTRGRMPAHEVCHFQKTLHNVLANKRRTQLSRRLMIKLKGIKAHKRNNTSIEMCLFKLFNSHYYSYDKKTRPTKNYDLPPLSQHDIFNEFTSHDFYYVSGFWPDQFDEIVDKYKGCVTHGCC